MRNMKSSCSHRVTSGTKEWCIRKTLSKLQAIRHKAFFKPNTARNLSSPFSISITPLTNKFLTHSGIRNDRRFHGYLSSPKHPGLHCKAVGTFFFSFPAFLISLLIPLPDFIIISFLRVSLRTLRLTYCPISLFTGRRRITNNTLIPAKSPSATIIQRICPPSAI